ncbi:hypothetical protein K440DRAFT_614597 [Wilcoxina mikolae CBS 423.85]|nr:hypothetical protein K440DRAFT_614597 [Wilcoxina mikolae CBS 423.85]
MTSLISFQRWIDLVANAFSLSGNTELFDGFPGVQPSDYETSTAKRDRTLKHLLRANHHNYAVMYHNQQFHNHLPHVLGSAYLMGASAEQLQALYDEESIELEAWEDSPQEITRDDWRDYLGDISYQRAYLDFFEDELVRMDYDWKKVVAQYMLVGPEPLIHGAICGLGHPLIHLGYAFELDNREIAMEALVLAATNYDFLHQYVSAARVTNVISDLLETSETSSRPVEILEELRNDSRFDGILDGPGENNIPRLFEIREEAILGYYHKLFISDITASHRELTKLATLMLCTTHEPGTPQYDFFIGHLLTTAYALRTLLPELPRQAAPTLLQAHWLFFVVVYCIQLRPKIKPELIHNVDVEGKSWDDICVEALRKKKVEGNVADTHYIKVVRILKEMATLWKDEDEFYMKAAIKFASEFKDWSGFGTTEEREGPKLR